MKNFDDAANLDSRVTFQRYVGQADLVGDWQYLDDANWEDVVTLWAEVRSISSRTFDAAGQENFEVTHNIRIRYRSWDYSAVTMRARCGGKIYRLLSPPLDMRGGKVWQILKAAEVWR